MQTNRSLLVLAFLILAGCGYTTAPQGGFTESVTSTVSPTDESIIVVSISDPLPVKSARLIAPDGLITEAFAIERDHQRYTDGGTVRPNVGVGVSGGSGSGISTGFGIGFPIFSSGGSGTTHLVTTSRVQIRIPDLASYRLAWQRYALAIDLDDGVNRRAFQMVPPPPR